MRSRIGRCRNLRSVWMGAIYILKKEKIQGKKEKEEEEVTYFT